MNPAFAVQEKEVDIDFAEHTLGALISEAPATTEDFDTKEHKDCTVCECLRKTELLSERRFFYES